MFAIANNNWAQENKIDFRNYLQLGIKIGTNYSNIYDIQGRQIDAVYKLGFAGGAFLTIPIGKFLGIQPELLYSQKGFLASGQILGVDYQYSRRSNYVDIPLFIQVKTSRIVTILFGPQLSFLVLQRDVFESVEIEQDFKKENIRKNIIGLTGGADVNLDHLVVGARIVFDIQNSSSNGISATPRYKNAWCQVSIGYRFYK